MIWILLGLLAVGAIVGIVMWNKTHSEDWGFLAVPCAIVAFILLVVLPLVTVARSARFAELEAFYQANSKNYEIAVDETASYLSEESFRQALIDGSIEKFELAGYVSERISEWRDAVNRYNTEIAKFKYYDSNVFLGVLYPDKVQDSKLLVID